MAILSPRRGGPRVRPRRHSILKAERLELVLTNGEGLWCCLNQTVVVAWSEFGAVDADKTARAVVSVEPERVDTWHVYAEWDAQVESDVGRSTVQAHIMVRKFRGISKRTVTVTHGFHIGIGTFGKCAHRLHVGAQTVCQVCVCRVVLAASCVIVDARKYYRLACVLAREHVVRSLTGRQGHLAWSVFVVADRALIDAVDATWIDGVVSRALQTIGPKAAQKTVRIGAIVLPA